MLLFLTSLLIVINYAIKKKFNNRTPCFCFCFCHYIDSMAGDGGGRNIENIEEEQRKRLELKDDLISMRDRFTAEESILVKKSNMLNVQV